MPQDQITTLPEPGSITTSLSTALSKRCSSRAFVPTPIPVQTLSNLLWAGFGINRKKEGLRTAPSPRNTQEMDIYLCTPDGVSRYCPDPHSLISVSDEDIREICGFQPFVADAALNLIYVADFTRMNDVPDPDNRMLFAWADAGAIAQNVSLFCATQELGTVVRASIDRDSLGAKLGLNPDQVVTLAQTVGFPA